ncbi:FmdB family zinc ribbon protein [Rhodanobacter ginsengiterrae]|uniref:FmdB family zinc ribbon protein n=1 Tax=Rhodanobacter ginsengiterrae TaxID=2008451 RepID=UPI003CFB75A0
MPIYEFECSHCGHRFDRLQKLSDTDPTVCPACDTSSLRRRVSAPSFRLAGSGWYETDFKKDGDKKRNLVDASPAEARPAASESAPAAATPAPAPSPAPAAGGTGSGGS